MSKLIYREPNGNWGVKGVSWAEIPDGLYGALYKLKDYEETGLNPAHVKELAGCCRLIDWTYQDVEHNVWQCGHCGALHRFEADGPEENGFSFCPYCGMNIDWGEEEDDDEPA
ncbi:hypothetical protein [Agathobaculum sp. Marseille-P7918]|uniref:hypothetical protein n=1 Tax=Agathobaculum sp. Marseille-P7918 TaxID=2479843 RepID=UPI000F634DAA|nr:hypothetical protein [Agathobaculum sp. Marseille-P7918]